MLRSCVNYLKKRILTQKSCTLEKKLSNDYWKTAFKQTACTDTTKSPIYDKI